MKEKICRSFLKKTIHDIPHGPSTEGTVKTFPHEIFDCRAIDRQVMPKPVEAFNFAPNHEFANFALNGVRQPVEDELFVDAGDQFGA